MTRPRVVVEPPLSTAPSIPSVIARVPLVSRGIKWAGAIASFFEFGDALTTPIYPGPSPKPELLSRTTRFLLPTVPSFVTKVAFATGSFTSSGSLSSP